MKSNLAFAAGLTAGVMATLSATLIAGQVTGLIEFTAGTPAKAAEVNSNFMAVKTAVDDNHARITTAETKLAKFGNPTPAANGSGVTCVLGQIMLWAGSLTGSVPATGQLLPIAQNQALFALLGTKFGGDGQVNFRLPDLRDLAPNGLTYTICIAGTFPGP